MRNVGLLGFTLLCGVGEVLGQDEDSSPQSPPSIEQTATATPRHNRQGRVELVIPDQHRKAARGRVLAVHADPFSKLDSQLQRLLNASLIQRDNRTVQGEDLYRSLSDRELAALLNFWTKARHIAEEKDAAFQLDSLHRLVEIEEHQLFLDVHPRLLESLRSSSQFKNVQGWLHWKDKSWTGEWKRMGSFKSTNGTRHQVEPAGNLQITVFRQGERRRVKLDIDYSGGLGVLAYVKRPANIWGRNLMRDLKHFFVDTVGSFVIRKKTDPYRIHDILTREQGLTLPYSVVREETR